MKRLLLDAQAVVWCDIASPALGENATKAIRNPNSVYVSAVSEWELAIKAALGKVKLRRSILEATLDAGFEPLAISFQHAQTVRSLKPIHRGSFRPVAGRRGVSRGAHHCFVRSSSGAISRSCN